jgi:hypothetical protein
MFGLSKKEFIKFILLFAFIKKVSFQTQEAFVPWYLHPVHSNVLLQTASKDTKELLNINNIEKKKKRIHNKYRRQKNKKLRKETASLFLSSSYSSPIISLENNNKNITTPLIPSHAINTDKGIMVKRYYHLFCKGELENLMNIVPNELDLSPHSSPSLTTSSSSSSPSISNSLSYPLLKFTTILKSGFDHENWYIEIQKN